jgi:hypothetical protein
MDIAKTTTAALAVLLLSAGSGLAQHADHGTHQQAPGGAGIPSEPGQGAFAAIAEIVAILAADSATDWRQVDIDALRLHLVDMNALMLDAEVEAERLPTGLAMHVSLAGRAGAAASRMVPAHGPVLAAETGWASEVLVREDDLQWTVTDPTGRDSDRIQALGFFGLMATGDHHRRHHLAMARGAAAH